MSWFESQSFLALRIIIGMIFKAKIIWSKKEKAKSMKNENNYIMSRNALTLFGWFVFLMK